MEGKNTNNKKSLAVEIQEKIRTSRIKMKSRSFFALETAAIIFGIIFVLGLSVFLSSAIHFFLHASGLWLMPGFGSPGFMFFLLNFPWPLIIITFLTGIILALLIKNISSSYRQPIIFVLIAIFVAIFACSFIFIQYPLHQKLHKYSEFNKIPIMQSFYQHFGRLPCHGSLIGIIASTTESGFIIETPEREDSKKEFNIKISPQTIFPGDQKIQNNNMVFIFGKAKDDFINAEGIMRINPNDDLLLNNFHQCLDW